MDKGAGNSYASAVFLDRISSGKQKKGVRKIEMLLEASTREVELAMIEISDVDGRFTMPVEVTRGHLIFLDNQKVWRNDCRESTFFGGRKERSGHQASPASAF